MKAILFVIIAASATAGASSHVFAQQWSPWDGPRRAPVEVLPDEEDDLYAGPRFEREDDSFEGPRAGNQRRYRDDDPRRYDPRYNGGPAYGEYEREDPRDGRPVARGYVSTPRGDYYQRPDAGDDYGAWDAAPSADEEARLSKSPAWNGGPKPYIKPVAPPQVAFSGPYAPGSVVIDTSARKLYYVLSATSAYAYPIGVGRQGFTWTGKEKVSRIADWPDWYPPAEMRRRRPELPQRMLGGIKNPLGAKAIYLGNTLYRIHGTDDPKSIGKAESSGCFRMLNENVLHLASLVRVGTEVTVVRSLGNKIASSAKTPGSESAQRARTTQRTTPAPRTIPRGAVRPDVGDDDFYDPYNGWH
ncbi:L,D-transpeptidase [Hyphomicrobium sp.]|uniref:L,D-transpeptidase n=1 Tax=Hyphomicrobium sp. TaxID=82 RepID=UPI002D79A0DC|nr:L,D-transpeptidase [Hyphomicrobium sp.]HET6390629.1 L,D-transpeptidase [Hyphomicrobium sp.]